MYRAVSLNPTEILCEHPSVAEQHLQLDAFDLVRYQFSIIETRIIFM